MTTFDDFDKIIHGAGFVVVAQAFSVSASSCSVSHMNADSKALSVCMRSGRSVSLKRSIMSALS